MNLTLKIWRQKNANEKGKIVEYKATDISPDMSFLEMMDVVNTDIINRGDDPVAFDHDCRRYLRELFNVYQWRSSWSW